MVLLKIKALLKFLTYRTFPTKVEGFVGLLSFRNLNDSIFGHQFCCSVLFSDLLPTLLMQFNLYISRYMSRKKYWFRANFPFPVFDGITRFGMSWTRFDYFWKMSVCVCVSVCVSCVWEKNFVPSVAQELMNRISWNFIFSITST